MRILHVAAYHRPDDGRIFRRECRSLVAAGHDVTLAANRPSTGEQDGVKFLDLGGGDPANDVRRSLIGFILNCWRRCWRVARAHRPEVVHFHEPLLIPVMVLLKLTGLTVVYDVHEDAPRQAAGQARNIGRPALGRIAAWGYAVLEHVARRSFDRFVPATPAIAQRFPPERSVTICNFPDEVTFDATLDRPWPDRPNDLVYIGYLFPGRGVREMVDLMDRLPADLGARLKLAGEFRPASLQQEQAARPGWRHVDFLGWIDADHQNRVMAETRVGLVVLHPQVNYLESLPTKLFAYMAAGLPVVASDFPLWRKIVEGANCGLLVDPLDVTAIARAVEHLLRHPEEAMAMGQRGRAAAREQYNWPAQERKLVGMYRDLQTARSTTADQGPQRVGIR